MFWFSVREGVLHPLDVRLQCDFSCGAIIPHGNRLILPLFEIGFFDLSDLCSDRMAFAALVADRDCLVIRN